MQNSRIIHVFPLNFFLFGASRLPRQLTTFFTGLLVLLVGLTTQGQVAPSSGAAPAAPSSANPAAPGRGTALPAGVNPANLPANVQQQLNQRGQNGTNGRTGNPTPAQQSRTGNNGNTTNTPNGTNGNQQFDKQDTNSESAPATDEEIAEERIKQAQRREQEERRQKLFGYSLFNDPAMAATFQPNINIATPRNYIVGPGDELNIRMFGYSEGDYSQKVSPEGFVYIAQQTGIGPIFVSGLPVEKAKERLISRMATKFVGLRNSSYGPQNTFLEVSLGSIRSIRVTVTGDAVRPGTYTMSGLSTVMNAIYQAGGPNDIGSYRKVQLIRNNRVVATLDLYDYLLNGIQQNDLRLQDNDNIRFTSFIERIEIGGAVKRSNIFEMLPGETLDRLLFYSGGFTANAYKGRLKVTRVTDRELKVTDVTAPEFKTFVMQDGDVVSVERVLNRFENKLTIEGAVFRPGEYSLDNNKTLKDLITSAEGLRGDAFTGRVNIVRTREDLAVENLSINLANILAGTDPDIPLQREDQVIIPSRFELAQQATISAIGELNKPDPGMAYMANMTLNDVLVKTGGLKESAAYSVVEVVRRKKDVDPKSPTAQIADIYRFNVNRDLTLSNDANRNFVLEPFDQIIVRRSPNYLEQTYAAVVGEVIMPGPYAIRSKDMKISDLVLQSGGLTPQAYVEGATLVRPVRLSSDELQRKQRAIQEVGDNASKTVVETEVQSPTSSESIGINLKKILAKPGSSEDILVQEGDTLRIPKLLETVRIQGEVQLPNTVKFRSGQTFQDYISQTGGFTSKSQRRKSFIVYANGSVDRTRKFMFFNVYPRVEPGAEIVVPKRTSSPLTPQQVLSSTAGTISSLLSVIGLIIALSRVGN
ncbi:MULTISPECIES: SLBB domain-containing protein [unclassified Spirosoma]|uniref:polysaccharide biosynthesis/export family protein n=1 Tax=unclassified Spirosoma TaxID=2621999 RepID=UPI00095C8F6E|nr:MULTISPECIES: SLBB domain-containing protein [unclassified Spirosoma]MBN8821375.1 SLBB domain-containing protein [Spirosoma sp.]OJW78162.1 MAG: ligand-binding protein [Spirosoma sp. 48-14]